MSSRRELISLDRRAAKLRRDWLTITVKELEGEIEKRGIRDTGALWHSLKGQHGSVMVLQYLMYGAFVDMNVGRGRTLETQRETQMIDRLHRQARGDRGRMAKPGRWYSKRMAREHKRLAELMAKMYADEGVDTMMANLPERIELLK